MEAHSRPKEAHLEGLRLIPGVVEAQPGALELHFGTMEAQPGTMKVCPGAEVYLLENTTTAPTMVHPGVMEAQQ
jgi:hypothetical protein